MMTGWQIYAAAADSVRRFWHVTQSQVYRELADLEKQGVVEAERASGPRDSRPFRITSEGKQALDAWLLDWVSEEPHDELLHSPLVLTVFFGEFLPEGRLKQTLQEYRLLHLRRLEHLRLMQEGIGADSGTAAATLRRGIAYHEMMIYWIDSVLTDLSV